MLEYFALRPKVWQKTGEGGPEMCVTNVVCDPKFATKQQGQFTLKCYVPSVHIREIFLHIRRRLPHDKIQLGMKRDIAQVRRRALAAHKPLFIGEFVIQDLQDATKVLDIASASFRVGLDERPVKDALEDWPLCRGLELEPLLRVVLLWQSGEGDALLGVVLVEDIIHNSARLGGLATAWVQSRTSKAHFGE